jgi:ribosomal protein S18 acetylase RimI-like enzyme
MDYAITQMTIDDFDEALALWQRTAGMGLDEDVDSREGIAVYLRRNAGLSFVARVDGQLVGTVLCGHDGRRGYLNHLAVDAAFRGRGIGSALVERCLTGLYAEGISRCNLFVFADNLVGQRFWLRHGWAVRANTIRLQTVTSPLCAKEQ